MIYYIKKPEAVNVIYPALKKFCAKAEVPYNVKQLAQFIRTNIGLNTFHIIAHREDEKAPVTGFAVYYVLADIMQPELIKVFVAQFFSDKKEAKKEMSENIINFTKENYIDTIEFVTYRDADIMIEKFNEIECPFKTTGKILSMGVA